MVGQESRVKHFAERPIFLGMQELIENCTNLQWSRNLNMVIVTMVRKFRNQINGIRKVVQQSKCNNDKHQQSYLKFTCTILQMQLFKYLLFQIPMN